MEEEEDELDLEYGYDDEGEDPSDYIHVDMPWGLRKFIQCTCTAAQG